MDLLCDGEFTWGWGGCICCQVKVEETIQGDNVNALIAQYTVFCLRFSPTVIYQT